LTVIDQLSHLLQKSRGACPVYLIVADDAGKQAQLRLGEGFRVNPATVPIRELEEVVGTGRVRFAGPGNGRNGK
jgi:hypothetical protein